MRLAFVYGRSGTLCPLDGEDQARGGIITSLYALTRTLAGRGHEMHVFGRCSQPARVAGVEFHDRGELARWSRSGPIDALIVIPEVLPLLLPIASRARIVWTSNAFATGDCTLSGPWTWAPDIGKSGHTARLYGSDVWGPYADLVIALSEWQADGIASTGHIARSKLAVIFYGVPLEFYEGPEPARHNHRLVYTSQARRGLSALLAMFPAVRAQLPDAELHVFGYDDPTDEIPAEALHQPGVVWRGKFSKSALASELREASVMAYPCTFKETFCSSVAEAQAAGLPVVASSLAALPERITDGTDGVIIAGRPGDTGFEEAFVQQVVSLLLDQDRRDRLGQGAVKTAWARYDWESVAQQWEAHIDAAQRHEPAPPCPDPDLELYRADRLRLADRGAVGSVPSDIAHEWLVGAWQSYGFDPAEISWRGPTRS